MQFYENLYVDDNIAIVFEGAEITLGLKIMRDLLTIMRNNGGSEAPEMQRWLKDVKYKQHLIARSVQ